MRQTPVPRKSAWGVRVGVRGSACGMRGERECAGVRGSAWECVGVLDPIKFRIPCVWSLGSPANPADGRTPPPSHECLR
jgi:hypothetical protein